MSKKVYKTSKVQQLIDLNEDLTNFKLRFNVTSKNDEEFDMAIADQYTIDNTPEEIVFKKVKNTISGTIVSDKNVFQNHFLILKSSGENPADVEVVINKQEIPPNPDSVKEKETKEDITDNTRRGGENDMRKGVESDMRRGGENDMRRGGENDMRRRESNIESDTRRGGESDMRRREINESNMRRRESNEGNMRRRDESDGDYERETYDENFENEKTTWIDIRLIIIVLICILGGIFVYNIVTKKNGITTNLPTVSAPSLVPQNMNFNLLNKLNTNIPR